MQQTGKDMDIVQNGLLFAFPKLEDAKAEAKNIEKLRTGIEPMMQVLTDRNGDAIPATIDPRMKSLATRKEVSQITVATKE
jgi:hypothetical protein